MSAGGGVRDPEAVVTFLVHRGKEYTVGKYLRSWGRALAPRIRVRTYPGLRATGTTPWKRASQRLRAWRLGSLDPARLPPPRANLRRVYVFTDVERLDDGETERALALRRRLLERSDTAAILNHPTRSLRRTELLETLHARGINDFAVYRPGPPGTPLPAPARWPVFVRQANDHSGGFSPLCHGREELEAAVAGLAAQGIARRDLVVIEHCDVADPSGVVRKLGAFRVGSEIIARHIHFSRRWVVRVPDIRTAESAAEERDFVARNPHAEALRAIFELARIDYGRIDYALDRAGRIQVWEINTNPMILIPKDRHDPLRRAAHDAFGRRFGAALETLLAQASAGETPARKA